jgi:hypothetical protein
MSKIYNIAFRMGVLFNVVLFTLLNIVSFVIARKNYEQESLEAPFFGHFGYHWGFPIEMFQNEHLAHPFLLVFNVAIYVACGFFFGFLFKFAWSKISRYRAELK